MSSTALYLHWPFCKHKCPYCDFNSHVAKTIDYDGWKQAYIQELTYFLPYLQNKTIVSVFFGGGTPSLMPGFVVDHILSWLRDHTNLAKDAEVTLEANPTSVESTRFLEYKRAGVNRLSMGIQSLRQDDLTFLGRTHTVEEAKQAIRTAKSIFDQYSFDLIYARPNQTLQAWQGELAEALELAGNHLSLYQLTIEKGTPFYAAYQQKAFELPDEETSAQLYIQTQQQLAAYGFKPYEISNYAKAGYECLHNLQYWEYRDYLGIGPGAHSRIREDNQKKALMMIHAPEQWRASVADRHHGIQQNTILSREEEWEETLLMGLRLVNGIQRARVELLAGMSLEALIPEWLLEKGLVQLTPEYISITEQGRLLTNAIIQAIINARSSQTLRSSK